MLHSTRPVSAVGSYQSNPFEVLFGQFLGTDGHSQQAERRCDVGPLSVWQDDNSMYVEVELPGVLEADVELTVHGEVLKIRAERRPEKDRVYLYNGRAHGRLDRDVVLPESVDSEHVEAMLTQGVLRVTLPKHPASRPRKIGLKTT